MGSTLFYMITLLLLVTFAPFSVSSEKKCVIFNFGDSNTDTGNAVVANGQPLSLPFGETYFHKPAGRMSDGRLYIDFLCQSLNISFLSAYLESSGSDFTHGVNFAVGGAQTDGARIDQLPSNFNLHNQTQQFNHFKNRTLELGPKGNGSTLSEEEFDNAIYTLDIGQNDLKEAFRNSSYKLEVALQKIPGILGKIEEAIEYLYNLGAKTFVIYGTGPFGCLPTNRAVLYDRKFHVETDRVGCTLDYNKASKVFNRGLSKLCNQLRAKHGATVVYIDMYTIKYDLFANPGTYGFDRPFLACCGQFPYDWYMPTCGAPMAPLCPDPSTAVSWDSNHYTDKANGVVASKILSGNYSAPYGVKIQDLCKGP